MAARAELADIHEPFSNHTGTGKIATQYEEFVFGRRIAEQGKIPTPGGGRASPRFSPSDRLELDEEAYLQAGSGHVRFERISGTENPSLPRRL